MFLIYISGIDGCGKTTQAHLIEKFFKEKGINAKYAWLRWDPSFRNLFIFFRSIIGKTKNKKTISRQHKEEIQHTQWMSLKKDLLSNSLLRWLWWEYACRDYYSFLKRKLRELSADVIIVDRYVHDFLIDQAINFGISLDDQFILLDKLKSRGFKFPNLNIIINLPAQEGYNRKFDGTALDYLIERERRYRSIPKSDITLHLDGMKDIDYLFKNISRWVAEKIGITQ
jgi:thymidylate kinase